MAKSRTVVSRGMFFAVGAVAVTTVSLYGTAIAVPPTLGPLQTAGTQPNSGGLFVIDVAGIGAGGAHPNGIGGSGNLN